MGMKKRRIRLTGLSVVTLLVLSMGFGCGSSNTNTISTAPPITVTVTLIPLSGTLDAVNPNSVFYEVLPSSAGIVDPNSIKISVFPSFLFTTVNGFSSGTFAGYVDIAPEGFLPPATTFSVTTNFLTNQNGTIYAATAYNAFTTATLSGTFSVATGDSYTVTVNNSIQPQGLALITAGAFPELAVTVLTTTAASNPTAAGADGSMILFGGQAFSSSSPTDINPAAFVLPLAASYKGNEFMTSGSAVLTVSGMPLPLQDFSLRGTVNADRTISNGVLYGVLHCVDAACSNITDATMAAALSPYTDGNGNMAVVGTFSGAANTFSPVAWIGAGDTATTTLADGIGAGISTTTLEVTTTTSSLIDTTTLPFVILTTTDANNMLGIAGEGQGAETITTTAPQVTVNYPLYGPGLALTPFSTTAGQTYQAFFMFGLTNSMALTFTP